ncbi:MULTISPECIES: hypothetical protein [unclassified Caballeronia]|uniref:hypothetical protein n=1 Tax=unclassified Caballeronia TaxID=2646786 RepID=UPI00158F21AF|nr:MULTISPECIES: hypothetical protein [unclassified Caballeronia]QSN63973.1 hypothetical protein JYK05_21885 [Caballeronia sp. M1242]
MKPFRSLPLAPLVVALALACAACSSSDDAASDARIVLSYARSASQWIDSWLDGSSPSSYATRSVDSASEQIGKIAGDLQRAHAPADAASQVHAVQAAFDKARAALDSGDRARVTEARSTMHDAAVRLDAWLRAQAGDAS